MAAGHRGSVLAIGRACLIALSCAAFAACRGESSLPDAGSEEYREVVSAFYAGLAAMEVSADEKAEAELGRVTELARAEPAAWANLGLLALRRSEYDVAAERLNRAAALAPESSSMRMLLGLLESQRGRPEEALAHLRAAVELDSMNTRAAFALFRELERHGRANEAELEAWLDSILRRDSTNSAVWVERLRVAVRQDDVEDARRVAARLRVFSASWPRDARDQLALLEEALSRADLRESATRATFLRNVLLRVLAFQEDLKAVETPQSRAGEPIGRLLRLPAPEPAVAPIDESLRFVLEPLPPPEAHAWEWVGVIALEEGDPEFWVADGRSARSGATVLPFPGGLPAAAPTRRGVTAVDFDNDFQIDLAMAGAGGFRLYRRERMGFADVTETLALPTALTDAAYTAVWAADLDLEGDLDLLLAGRLGPPRLLRNNGDGTFTALRAFETVDGLTDFVWADLVADGAPDGALLDRAGRLRVFVNERGGTFTERRAEEDAGVALGLTAADVDDDGVLDLVWVDADGAVRSRAVAPDRAASSPRELARWPGRLDGVEPGQTSVLFADLDNNGGLDLLIATPTDARVWLRDGGGEYHPLADPIAARVFSLADLQGDGRLDAVGLKAPGEVVVAVNRGDASYHWTRLRPRAAQVVGDQRINSFGLGGEVEIRSGLLYQKQPIAAPVVHFGLGQNTSAAVARILWPNGVVQAEFDLASNEAVRAEQRLKGSCPWVFAHDGTRLRFITDFLWRSPLGMRINAQETAGVSSTEDRIRIGGDQLVARDGTYDVRITAELWETHFFDHVSLLAVDHPVGTGVFIDERFVHPPPSLDVRAVGPLQPIAVARDDRGTDVTEVVRALDERYLDTFELGRYQGVARDHHVEIELGEEAPDAGPLWLVASGWTRPTDSSINLALSQGRGPRPHGLRLEVPDGRGGWTVAREDLGFPAGKTKTILLDLQGLFPAGGPRRLRLATNLEVYWDRIAWAAGRPDAPVRARSLFAARAELRPRGFSEVRQAAPESPELPIYERRAGTAPRWRDLVGYYTRFGDVRELLEEADDRYVIMNAGDELAFRFAAPAPPPEGWTRDFVLVGVGWVKDGDYNTAFSKTVRPLPAYDRPEYLEPPGPLDEDPVYRRYPDDWRAYHTRFVAPERFHSALVPSRQERQ